MVNNGVSRGCETCRKRRKKCDEQRPTCMRCAQARKICMGYRDDGLHSRHYAPPRVAPSQLHSFEEGMDEQSIEDYALAMLLEDYVVSLANPVLSRGFLDGLSSLLANANPSSDLVQAAQLVACASLGNRQNLPKILEKARQKYVTLLRSFHLSLSREMHAPSIEALVTAVLLGLYEIVSSNEIDSAQHVPHVCGVSAILRENASPFDFSAIGNPLILKQPLQPSQSPGVLCAPGSDKAVQSLDSILVQCHPLFQRANELLENSEFPRKSLEQTFEYARTVEESFARWITNHVDSWTATIVGTISRSDAKAPTCPYFWPGPVHEYFDVYVAAVMNTYRKTRLMLLDSLSQVAQRLNQTEEVSEWEQQSRVLIEDILASIPYHLANGPQEYLTAITSGTTPSMGRPVGGLLLLHPLFVLASFFIVPEPVKTYVRQCLSWIVQHMGIAQATLMSKGIENISFQHMSQGYVLIWAGMLLQPSNGPNGRPLKRPKQPND